MATEIPQSGGDLFSTLANAPVAISGTTLLGSGAFGKLHTCTGSTVYTVTLPAPAAGRVIGVRVAGSMSGLVTLARNSTDTIDGATARVMHSGESAILVADGTDWHKVAGVTIPFSAVLQRSVSNYSLSGLNSWQPVPMQSQAAGHPALYDAGAGRIVPCRPGIYTCTAFGYYSAGSAGAESYCTVAINGAYGSYGYQSGYGSGGAVGISFVCVAPLAVGDYVEAALYPLSGSNPVAYGPGAPSSIAVAEVPSW